MNRLLALALVLAIPTFALAETPGGKKNILSPDLINSGVTVIVFLALLAILYKFAWGPILKGLAAREAAQHKALEEARSATEAAAKMKAELQNESAKAQEQIRAMMDEARRDAEALRASGREAGLKDVALERDRAKREIDAAREAALQEIYQKSVQLAALMASKSLRREMSVNPGDQQRLIDESLAELTAKISRN